MFLTFFLFFFPSTLLPPKAALDEFVFLVVLALVLRRKGLGFFVGSPFLEDSGTLSGFSASSFCSSSEQQDCDLPWTSAMRRAR
ncbi:MAG: hypothetical protein AAF492_32235, partial [Verrucomicrobiota bacterium]